MKTSLCFIALVCYSAFLLALGGWFDRDEGHESLRPTQECQRPATPESAPVERVERVDATPVDTTSFALRIAALEAENAHLRAELSSERLAAVLVLLDESLTTAQVLSLLDNCYLTEDPTDRALYGLSVRPPDMIQLLRAEPAFRTKLAETKRNGSADYRRFEWPAERDRLVADFFQHLRSVGVPTSVIERYRVSLADYF